MIKPKQLLVMITMIVMWIYIGWRILFTLPYGIALIPGLMLLIAEFALIIQNTFLYSLIYRPNEKKSPLEITKNYKVDLFLATYNESVKIVRRTVLASKNIDYPADQLSIWICDDGRREEMRDLAQSLGVGYISRDTNEHAKAGNLNNALTQTSGEIIVTIDADMMPKPNFLKHTLGYFEDENVAFVQTPQSFYNEDIFQYNLAQGKNIPNEQDLFMRVIQSGMGRFNSTLYVGSNTIFKRKALESIGGFATGTITEDMATGMLIQAKGFKTIFHNEVLAQGLAAETITDYLSQRIRWARGTIQTMRKWNPLTLPGLTPIQRSLYISYLIYWFFGVFRMIFILAPIVYLLFGIPALKATITGILIFWLPYYLLTAAVEYVLLENRLKRFWSNIYEASIAPFLAWAVLVETLTRRSISFKVTSKGITNTSAKINIPFLVPHLILLVVSVAAAALGISQLTVETRDGVLINLFWLFYNLLIIVPVMLLARERPKLREDERFQKELRVDLLAADRKVTASTIDISETGCRIFFDQMQSLPNEVMVVIHGKNSTYPMNGSIVYYDIYDKGYQAGIHFQEMEDSVFQLWIKELYGETPPESMFQFQSGTGFVNVISKFWKEMKTPYKKKERISPRVQTSIECSVVGISNQSISRMIEDHIDQSSFVSTSEVTNAHLMDIGLQGCRVIVKGIQRRIGEVIGIKLPRGETLILGKIVRMEQNRDELELGVKWIDDEKGEQILDIIY